MILSGIEVSQTKAEYFTYTVIKILNSFENLDIKTYIKSRLKSTFRHLTSLDCVRITMYMKEAGHYSKCSTNPPKIGKNTFFKSICDGRNYLKNLVDLPSPWA